MQVKHIAENYSAIVSTFIKLPFVIKIFVCLFMSGRFTQVLLYVSSMSMAKTSFTNIANFSTKHLVMCKVYNDVGGINLLDHSNLPALEIIHVITIMYLTLIILPCKPSVDCTVIALEITCIYMFAYDVIAMP